jgi:preprotein translocase subunit SecF
VIQLIPHTLNIDFLKISKPFVWASLFAVALSITGMFTKGLNYGIDFTGGAEVQLRAPADWDIAKLRSTLAEADLRDAVVIQLGSVSDHQFLVKTQTNPDQIKNIGEKIETAIKAKAGTSQYLIERIDVVGPQAGAELRTSAILSVFMAALGILIYITFRFDSRFAPGLVRALLLDVIITLGFWVLLQKEFTLTTVAALLTIAGYSCNDTIVIYDRIRDYTKEHPTWTLYEIVNRSINLNLGRTFITVIATLFVVVSLWLLGGPVIGDFALAMLIGFAVSIISTIFIANPMVIYMEKRRVHAPAAGGKH